MNVRIVAYEQHKLVVDPGAGVQTRSLLILKSLLIDENEVKEWKTAAKTQNNT